MATSFAFEGGEGAGKTAQVRILTETLEEIGKPVLLIREPGGTPPGEAIREILRKDEFKDIHALTNLFLYSAARSELIFHTIVPWLQQNPEGISLSDRCWWSTFALQAVDGADEEFIDAVQQPFIRLWPDKFIYTDLHPAESMVRMERAKIMGEDRQWWRDKVDIDTYRKIRERYLGLVQKYRDRTLVLDGFLDPATRACDTLEFILGEKPFEYSSEKKAELIRKWEGVTKISYSNALEVEEEARKSLGFPDREFLHEQMLAEWGSLGLSEGKIHLERE